MSNDFRYTGELDLFASARNWKAYWGSIVSRYVGCRVLEVGAGTGATIRQLCTELQKTWVSIEPDARLAEQMRRDRAAGRLPQRLEIEVCQVADLPPADPFDTVLYIDVLEHIENDRLELDRASKHLACEGHIIVLAPAHQWLFSPFDAAVGHFRRYSRDSLLKVGPPGAVPVYAAYLDSVGLLASLGNRFILRSAMPNRNQIRLWDKVMVPVSRIVDSVTLHNFGKSVLVVWRKTDLSS
jgi:SAM-dependent methyltransferase